MATLFDRWTDRNRRALVLAQEQARMLGEREISTGHMLIGLLLEGESAAYRVLAALGVTAEGALDELVKTRPRGEAAPAGHIPFTAAAKRACEVALHESLRADVRYIGPEHVLLALLRDDDGEPVKILAALGVSAESVRAKVAELLAGYAKADAPPAPPDVGSDKEMRTLRDAFLRVHEATCERCATLALLCPDCRKSLGECIVRGQIERLPWEVPADVT